MKNANIEIIRDNKKADIRIHTIFYPNYTDTRYTVLSEILTNTKRTFHSLKEAIEYRDYIYEVQNNHF